MNNKGRLKIGFNKYEIIEVKDLIRDKNNRGEINRNNYTILLDSNCEPIVKTETLFHEITHCILDQMDNEELGLDEHFVELLSKQILYFILENKGFVERVMGDDNN
ncbi:hypothetical protein MHBO_002834 [Bonamia ostreae]|uniref:IrrE N-terminal-like domain-containing protein n=1 Tax=Bonamia ostreae TaxID=126728 RepID=A0ABV2AP93_9EUKA